MLSAITEMEPHYRKSSQQQLLLETLLVRFALLDRTVEIEELLRGLGDGGSSRPATTSAASPGRRPPDAPKSGGRAEAPGPVASVVTAPRADAVVEVPQPQLAPLDLNQLCEKWGDVVDRVKRAGGPMLVSALEHALPVAVSGQGTITVQLEQPNEIFERALESNAAEVVAAVSSLFAGARKLAVKRGDATASVSQDAPKRLSEEEMREERAQLLRKKNPALDAAIRELDLELRE
jgi:DNA polymerase-3 subunit gamma/tau